MKYKNWHTVNIYIRKTQTPTVLNITITLQISFNYTNEFIECGIQHLSAEYWTQAIVKQFAHSHLLCTFAWNPQWLPPTACEPPTCSQRVNRPGEIFHPVRWKLELWHRGPQARQHSLSSSQPTRLISWPWCKCFWEQKNSGALIEWTNFPL